MPSPFIPKPRAAGCWAQGRKETQVVCARCQLCAQSWLLPFNLPLSMPGEPMPKICTIWSFTENGGQHLVWKIRQAPGS